MEFIFWHNAQKQKVILGIFTELFSISRMNCFISLSVVLKIVFFLLFFPFSARYAYENCVFISAKHKCKLESAHFMRRLARLLSTERHFQNCDKIEKDFCSSQSSIKLNKVSMFVVFIVVPFYYVIFKGFLLSNAKRCS